MAKGTKVLIVGVGQIGGALGLALMQQKGSPWHVVGVEENGDYRQIAMKRKNGARNFPVSDFGEQCADAEIVVVATPMSVLPNVVLSCSEALLAAQRNKKRATIPVITDVGSVKSPLLTEFGGGLSPYAPFIGGHPIAGNEKSGPEAAEENLFKKKLVVLTPVKKTDPKALARVRELWEGVGAEVEEMTPQEHDQALAATSHLPHLIAFGLIEAIVRLSKPTAKRKAMNLFRYAAGGLKDFTRIAASSGLMWRDIAMENQACILEALGEFKKVLSAIEEGVARGDAPKLQEIFTHAETVRKSL